MNVRFKYAAMTTLAASAFVVLPAGGLPSAAAAVPVPILSSESGETAEEHARPLLELITSDRRGRFYTLNADEAETAVREHGFKRTDEADGITMFNRELDGTVAVHRLRLLRKGHVAYLLASNPDEISKLSSPSGDNGLRFEDESDGEDEAPVGYVYKERRPGTMKLVRYSNDKGDWRVARDGRVDLLAAGFKVDGPLGYVPKG